MIVPIACGFCVAVGFAALTYVFKITECANISLLQSSLSIVDSWDMVLVCKIIKHYPTQSLLEGDLDLRLDLFIAMATTV